MEKNVHIILCCACGKASSNRKEKQFVVNLLIVPSTNCGKSSDLSYSINIHHVSLYTNASHRIK